MKISYYRKNVYGNELMYITGIAELPIGYLTGRKTVTAGDLSALQDLGHEIEEVIAPKA